MVSYLRYLGRTLTAMDDNRMAVVYNLLKDRLQW